MKALSTVLLLPALALAVPAFAGEASIVETDEGYVVEYTGDATEKAPEKPAAPTPTYNPYPGRGAALPPKAAPTVQGEPAAEQQSEAPARVRDQNRRERSRKSRTMGEPEFPESSEP